MRSQEKGEELLNKIYNLKDMTLHVAHDILFEYEALGLQYGRGLKDDHQREEYYIQLGRKIEYFRNRLQGATINEHGR